MKKIKWFTKMSNSLLAEIGTNSCVLWEDGRAPTYVIEKESKFITLLIVSETGFLTSRKQLICKDGQEACYYPLTRAEFIAQCAELKPKPKEVYCCKYTHLLMELIESKSNVLWAGGTRPTKYSAEEMCYIELRGECYNTAYLTYSPVVADSNRLVTYDKFIAKCAELSPKMRIKEE